MRCALTPCVCLGMLLDKKLEMLKLERKISLLREKTKEAAEKVADKGQIKARGEE